MRKYGILGRAAILPLAMLATHAGANWDGEPVLDDIDFNLESFIDISSYQFRHSEDLRWHEVETGLRVAAGSLETNYLYLNTDLRLKTEITPQLTARLWLQDEAFYEPREFPRPLLELEGRPADWPLSFSLLGTPAYAKREADLGLALTLGRRPWSYFRVAWLNEDYYFNEKNELDGSYYAREPGQLTLEGAYQWADRYKLRAFWQENSSLEYVLDDRLSVFAYENRNYRLSLDMQVNARDNLGIAVRGFETTQGLDEVDTARTQDLRYYSIDGYWYRALRQRDEWTVGLRYDAFVNQERNSTPAGSFDYVYWTAQVYTSYYHPFSAHQAWELGLHLGQAKQQKDFLYSTLVDEQEDRVEAKLRAGWELFSLDRSSALCLALSLNLDEISTDPFDGGSVRFRSEF